jgi:hypothetical protein
MSMNTKSIMSASAVVMGIAGIALSFIPQEILSYFDVVDTARANAVLLQVMGALYFAFAMTNWTARANLIGGIYGRPIAIGNLCHFTIAALALVKAYFRDYQSVLLIPVIVYAVFAIAFAWIFFTHPVREQPNNS